MCWGRVCAAPADPGNIFPGCPAAAYTQEKCSRRACVSARPWGGGVQHVLHACRRPGFTSPVKFPTVLVVQINRNEHELLVVEFLWPRARAHIHVSKSV